ncbi:ADP-ribose glycohydrolase OARD1-like [Xiphophorus hellerii]|uniref:ADP-ribose glycohydrolase OARD1-like n=1 Tax=Xiphophorus hellerii TaxID=8084 RepID=UPI0013B410E2|nr:ADP-ribose glycohydrolase OARD1-like [Xiphophorus hellerii]
MNMGKTEKLYQSTNWTLKYVTGDLFSCPRDESLAHCISEDCRMGAGIAVMFKKKFGRVSELKEQKKLSGQCAVLTHDQRFIYYLVNIPQLYCTGPKPVSLFNLVT